MILKTKRQMRQTLTIMAMIASVLLLTGALLLNRSYLKSDKLAVIIILLIAIIILAPFITLVIGSISDRGFVKHIQKRRLLHFLEQNLIAIGAYEKKKNCAVLPTIKIKEGTITIRLSNIKVRHALERYLDTLSTALPERYLVNDYYFTKNNNALIIEYEDIKNSQPESYTLAAYKDLISHLRPMTFYFDKNHSVDLNDYPHFLVSGASGSGKTYLVNELVIQAIIKGWDVTILDLKRSYGIFRRYTDYVYEVEDILERLVALEKEMQDRLEALQSALDKNPRVLAVDIGYCPKLIVIEEYIALQGLLEKKDREELEKIVKNISVLARQSNLHLVIVMQSAGTENIQASTRNNLTKVLLGNAQSNILTATFGTGVELPNRKMRASKGEGLIQLDRISVLRVPAITDIENLERLAEPAAGRA